MMGGCVKTDSGRPHLAGVYGELVELRPSPKGEGLFKQILIINQHVHDKKSSPIGEDARQRGEVKTIQILRQLIRPSF